MARKVSTKFKSLRNVLLPKLGAIWHGTDEQFVEFVVQAIPQMPEQVRDAMQRFYGDGGTQYRNPNTGKTESTDSRFYLHLVHGRGILATMIRLAQNDMRPLELLEDIYGSN